MVRETDTVYRYTLATDAELDDLLAGKMAGNGISFSSFSELTPPQSGFIGVVSAHSLDADVSVRPLVVVSHEEDIRRLCGRYAQLRNDLSPLTAWCHLLTPKFFTPLDAFARQADLSGMEAAWVGLVVAETVLLVDRPLASVRISACLATQSFAIARASALWRVSIDEVLRRFDAANQLCRNESAAQREESRAGKLRSSLRPLWATLSACMSSDLVVRSEIEATRTSLRGLAQARRERLENEAFYVAKPLLDMAPEAEPFERLQELTPEMRLRLFDRLIEALNSPADRSSVRHHALALLAGYLATVAAGGAPSLALAETHAARLPEITAWAYLTGGIGERVTWASGFDGLGRLVARELLRPFRLDESPTCDFSFDEAAVLADTSLADPLVHLRVKQARQVGVGLLPGVNVSIPILEPSTTSKQEGNRSPRLVEPRDPMAAMAEALWPHLRGKLDEYFQLRERRGSDVTTVGSGSRGRAKKKSVPTQLPLPDASKK